MGKSLRQTIAHFVLPVRYYSDANFLNFCMLFYLRSEIVCSGRLSNMSFVAIFFGFGFL